MIVWGNWVAFFFYSFFPVSGCFIIVGVLFLFIPLKGGKLVKCTSLKAFFKGVKGGGGNCPLSAPLGSATGSEWWYWSKVLEVVVYYGCKWFWGLILEVVAHKFLNYGWIWPWLTIMMERFVLRVYDCVYMGFFNFCF